MSKEKGKKPTKKTAKKKVAKKKVAKKKAAPYKFNFKDSLPGDIVAAWLQIDKSDPRWFDPKFWKMEIKILQRLCEKYTSEFMEELPPFMKIETMLILEADFFRRKLNNYSKIWHFTPPKSKEKPIKIYKKKYGEDLPIKKKASFRAFLSNGKTKTN